MKKKCKLCGETFQGLAALIRKRQYCSRKCAGTVNAAKMPRKKKVYFVCKQCGKRFVCKPSQRKQRRYCSIRCASAARIVKVKKATKKCKWCKKSFSGPAGPMKKREYCSRECVFDMMRVEPSIRCSMCGRIFHRSPSQLKSKRGEFCSKRCARLGKVGGRKRKK